MHYLFFAIFSFIAVLFSYGTVAQIPPSALTSEKSVTQALLLIYRSDRISLFCRQPFDEDGILSAGQPEKLDDSLIRKDKNKIIWAQVVAPKILAANRPCYLHSVCMNKKGQRFKGLNCCKQNDNLYNIMTRDLHNRIPVTAKVAGVMKQYQFDRIANALEETIHSPACGITLYPKQKIMTPADFMKGRIARAYLYMQDTYGLSLPQSQRELFEKWHLGYPPSMQERQANKAIYQIQGNLNPYISG